MGSSRDHRLITLEQGSQHHALFLEDRNLHNQLALNLTFLCLSKVS